MIATAPANGSDIKTRLEVLTEEVSASRLKRWSTCRLQFFYHYVQQIKKPATRALVVGKVVHSVLQEWNKYRWRSDGTFREKLNEVFEAKWTEESQQGTEWDGEEEQEKLKTLGLIEFYLANTPIKPDEKPVAVEVILEADLSQHGLPKLIGVIDLVRPTGQIVDFKTSATTPNADNVAHLNQIQLTAYSILFRENTGQVESSIQLQTLVKTKTPKLVITEIDAITDQQQTRLFKQIESYVNGVQAEDYVPMPGMACLSCQFMNECKAWH
jgi:CRISPR/Cas system-associated exonuclease Cas4 (RecB family)